MGFMRRWVVSFLAGLVATALVAPVVAAERRAPQQDEIVLDVVAMPGGFDILLAPISSGLDLQVEAPPGVGYWQSGDRVKIRGTSTSQQVNVTVSHVLDTPLGPEVISSASLTGTAAPFTANPYLDTPNLTNETLVDLVVRMDSISTSSRRALQTWVDSRNGHIHAWLDHVFPGAVIQVPWGSLPGMSTIPGVTHVDGYRQGLILDGNSDSGDLASPLTYPEPPGPHETSKTSVPWWLDRLDQTGQNLDGINLSATRKGAGQKVAVITPGTPLSSSAPGRLTVIHEVPQFRGHSPVDTKTQQWCDAVATGMVNAVGSETAGTAPEADIHVITIPCAAVTNQTSVGYMLAAMDTFAGQAGTLDAKILLGSLDFQADWFSWSTATPQSADDFTAADLAINRALESLTTLSVMPVVSVSMSSYSRVGCPLDVGSPAEWMSVAGVDRSDQPVFPRAGFWGYADDCIDIYAPSPTTTTPATPDPVGLSYGDYDPIAASGLVAGHAAVVVAEYPHALPGQTKSVLLAAAHPAVALPAVDLIPGLNGTTTPAYGITFPWLQCLTPPEDIKPTSNPDAPIVASQGLNKTKCINANQQDEESLQGWSDQDNLAVEFDHSDRRWLQEPQHNSQRAQTTATTSRAKKVHTFYQQQQQQAPTFTQQQITNTNQQIFNEQQNEQQNTFLDFMRNSHQQRHRANMQLDGNQPNPLTRLGSPVSQRQLQAEKLIAEQYRQQISRQNTAHRYQSTHSRLGSPPGGNRGLQVQAQTFRVAGNLDPFGFSVYSYRPVNPQQGSQQVTQVNPRTISDRRQDNQTCFTTGRQNIEVVGLMEMQRRGGTSDLFANVGGRYQDNNPRDDDTFDEDHDDYIKQLHQAQGRKLSPLEGEVQPGLLLNTGLGDPRPLHVTYSSSTPGEIELKLASPGNQFTSYSIRSSAGRLTCDETGRIRLVDVPSGVTPTVDIDTYELGRYSGHARYTTHAQQEGVPQIAAEVIPMRAGFDIYLPTGLNPAPTRYTLTGLPDDIRVTRNHTTSRISVRGLTQEGATTFTLTQSRPDLAQPVAQSILTGRALGIYETGDTPDDSDARAFTEVTVRVGIPDISAHPSMSAMLHDAVTARDGNVNSVDPTQRSAVVTIPRHRLPDLRDIPWITVISETTTPISPFQLIVNDTDPGHSDAGNYTITPYQSDVTYRVVPVGDTPVGATVEIDRDQVTISNIDDGALVAFQVEGRKGGVQIRSDALTLTYPILDSLYLDTPTLNEVNTSRNAVRFTIGNYRTDIDYRVFTTHGAATISPSGQLHVTGITPGTDVAVMVTGTHHGHVIGSASAISRTQGRNRPDETQPPQVVVTARDDHTLTATITHIPAQAKLVAHPTDGSLSFSPMTPDSKGMYTATATWARPASTQTQSSSLALIEVIRSPSDTDAVPLAWDAPIAGSLHGRTASRPVLDSSPTFGSHHARIRITNYNPTITYSAISSLGQAHVHAGSIYVTGLQPHASVSVAVMATQPKKRPSVTSLTWQTRDTWRPHEEGEIVTLGAPTRNGTAVTIPIVNYTSDATYAVAYTSSGRARVNNRTQSIVITGVSEPEISVLVLATRAGHQPGHGSISAPL